MWVLLQGLWVATAETNQVLSSTGTFPWIIQLGPHTPNNLHSGPLRRWFPLFNCISFLRDHLISWVNVCPQFLSEAYACIRVHTRMWATLKKKTMNTVSERHLQFGKTIRDFWWVCPACFQCPMDQQQEIASFSNTHTWHCEERLLPVFSSWSVCITHVHICEDGANTDWRTDRHGCCSLLCWSMLSNPTWMNYK